MKKLKQTVYVFEIYKDRKKQWRWRLKANNGKTIADSAEGYKRNPEKQIMKIALALGMGNFTVKKRTSKEKIYQKF